MEVVGEEEGEGEWKNRKVEGKWLMMSLCRIILACSISPFRTCTVLQRWLLSNHENSPSRLCYAHTLFVRYFYAFTESSQRPVAAGIDLFLWVVTMAFAGLGTMWMINHSCVSPLSTRINFFLIHSLLSLLGVVCSNRPAPRCSTCTRFCCLPCSSRKVSRLWPSSLCFITNE